MQSIPRSRWKSLGLSSLVVLLVGMLFALTQQQTFAAPLTPRTPHAAQYAVLFDDAHAETAGNADWIISKSMPDPLQENPNPQTETDWTGGISSWGVALQKTGRYSLDTNTSPLTYNDATNALDLSHFNALILPEPNTLFSSSEKTAILSFVQNGGGLFMVADHNGSDRNNDGNDSLHIFNDLMNNGGAGNDVFGIQFDAQRIAKDYPGTDTPNPDPILQGPFGNATTSLINQGTTETINPNDNPNVHGVIYITGASNTGTTGVFFARSQYGNGRVIAMGDSSAIDDGTCESGNTCYNGWGDPQAQNAILFPNGTEWLASGNGASPTPTATQTATITATASATNTPIPPSPTVTATATPGLADTPTPSAGNGNGNPPPNCWWFFCW